MVVLHHLGLVPLRISTFPYFLSSRRYFVKLLAVVTKPPSSSATASRASLSQSARFPFASSIFFLLCLVPCFVANCSRIFAEKPSRHQQLLLGLRSGSLLSLLFIPCSALPWAYSLLMSPLSLTAHGGLAPALGLLSLPELHRVHQV
jgi:hypothetical protein